MRDALVRLSHLGVAHLDPLRILVKSNIISYSISIKGSPLFTLPNVKGMHVVRSLAKIIETLSC